MSMPWSFNTIEESKSALVYWQNKLGLSDWIIDLRLCSLEFLDDLAKANGIKEANLGFVEYSTDYRVAKVYLLCESDYLTVDFSDILRFCQESNLVHELLHVVMDVDSAECDNSQKLHRSIETIARALIMSKYGLYLSDLSANCPVVFSQIKP